jgi:predicted  nucleic acid-binding Zn-ribbon protein
MTTQDPKAADFKDISVEEKLRTLYEMQRVDADIDKIRTLRGELPLEVQDLEDEIAGLDTRINNLNNEAKEQADTITKKKHEFQNLEIELCEKRIKEFNSEMDKKKALVESSQSILAEKNADLNMKKAELDQIVAETQKEEDKLGSQSDDFKGRIEERLLTAYARIRENARNRLAVVTVERNACGGCFNKIPPQRQLDIRSRKKIIVCEYCGRILVDRYICDFDHSLEEADKAELAAKSKRRTRKTKAE